MLYSYFKQLFAQVTNPAMDSINEGTVMSLYSTLGAEKNLLEETPEHARMVRCNRPIITDEELERIRNMELEGFPCATLSALFKVADGGDGLRAAAGSAVRRGRPRGPRRRERADPLGPRRKRPISHPIPMLLATGAVHHHLVRSGPADAAAARVRDRRGARRRAHRAADRLRSRVPSIPTWPWRRSRS